MKRGFSLVELLVVITIIAIMLAFGIPSLISYLPQYRLTSGINQLAGDLRLARQKAITEGNNFLLYIPNQWHDPPNDPGYYLEVDDNDNNFQRSAGDGDREIRLPTGIELSSLDGLTSPIMFIPRGTVVKKPGGSVLPQSGTVTLVNRKGVTASLQITTAGMILVE